MLNKHLIKAVFVVFLPLIARYPLAGVKREVQVFYWYKGRAGTSTCCNRHIFNQFCVGHVYGARYLK